MPDSLSMQKEIPVLPNILVKTRSDKIFMKSVLVT